MKAKSTILISILVILIFLLGICVSQLYNEVDKKTLSSFTPNQIPNSEQEILDNCKNLNLTDSAFCLRDNIRTFYNYTSTDDEKAKDMTFEEIKTIGTDCGGYAYFYARLGERLGFNVTTTRYSGVKGVFSSHRWAVLWDSEKNCRIDQLSVKCHKNIEKEKGEDF